MRLIQYIKISIVWLFHNYFIQINYDYFIWNIITNI